MFIPKIKVKQFRGHLNLSPSQIIARYESIPEDYAQKTEKTFFAEKYEPPKTGSNKAARQHAVVKFCDAKGYS